MFRARSGEFILCGWLSDDDFVPSQITATIRAHASSVDTVTLRTERRQPGPSSVVVSVRTVAVQPAPDVGTDKERARRALVGITMPKHEDKRWPEMSILVDREDFADSLRRLADVLSGTTLEK